MTKEKQDCRDCDHYIQQCESGAACDLETCKDQGETIKIGDVYRDYIKGDLVRVIGDEKGAIYWRYVADGATGKLYMTIKELYIDRYRLEEAAPVCGLCRRPGEMDPGYTVNVCLSCARTMAHYGTE